MKIEIKINSVPKEYINHHKFDFIDKISSVNKTGNKK
jgi:hypothetical protein